MANEEFVKKVRVDDQASGPLRDVAREQDRVGESVQRTGRAAKSAEPTMRSREERAGRMRRRLKELATAEAEHQQRVARGAQVSRADLRASQRRRSQLSRIGRVLSNQSDVQRRANDLMADSERVTGRATSAIGRGAGAVRGMVQSWLGFTAIVGAIVSGFKAIRDASAEALRNVVELGESLRGLARNVGGRRADQVLGIIDEVLADEPIGKAGRQGVIQAMGHLTDFEPDLSDEQFRTRALGFARLARATDTKGAEASATVQALRSRFGLSFEDAVDQAAVLINAGMEPGVIQQTAERTAERGGGERLMALMFAARADVDLRRGARMIDTITSALTRVDEEGLPHEDLAAVGITPEMDEVERIAQVARAEAAGRATRDEVDRAIGGARNRRLFGPLGRRAIEPGGVDRAVAELRSGGVDEEIARMLSSQAVRTAERAAERELAVHMASERFGGSRFAERFEIGQTELRELGAGSALLGFLRAAVSGFPGVDQTPFDEAARRRRERLEAMESDRGASDLPDDLPLPIGGLDDPLFGAGGEDLGADDPLSREADSGRAIHYNDQRIFTNITNAYGIGVDPRTRDSGRTDPTRGPGVE